MRRWPLARLLLNPRLALLFLVASLPSMFACVIPVAPDFQDPLAAANSPPYLHDPSPARSTFSVFGSASSVPTYPFSSQVTDLNAQDDIYYRWVLNYPPSSGTTTVNFDVPYGKDSAPATGSVHNYTAIFEMSCASIQGQSVSPGTLQQLTLIVADRQFLESLQLDKVPAGTFPQQITWPIIFQCGAGTP